MDQLRTEVRRTGVAVVRQVLTTREVERLRRDIDQHMRKHRVVQAHGATQPNAAVAIPSIEWVFRHPIVIDIFRRVLGRDDIVFTRHADAHVDFGSSWHKDDGSGGELEPHGYFGLPQHVPECEVYKMGLYLEGSPGRRGADGADGNAPRAGHLWPR